VARTVPTTCLNGYQYDAAAEAARTSEIYAYDAGNDSVCTYEGADYRYDGHCPYVFLTSWCQGANSTGKERDSESGLDNFGGGWPGYEAWALSSSYT
jgi:hypothetical protein